MPDPYLSEIRVFGFDFVPAPNSSWAACDGQLLQIASNPALYSLLGTRYGGDGRTTFALPNLRGRVPMSVGFTHRLSDTGGEDVHVLTEAETPTHTHAAMGSSGSDTQVAAADGGVLGAIDGAYAQPDSVTPVVSLIPTSLGLSGASSAHDNRQPSLALNVCIATTGIFPQRP